MPEIKPGMFRGVECFYVVTSDSRYIHADGKAYEYTHGNDYLDDFNSHNMTDYPGWFETREEAEEAVEKYTEV